VKRQGQKGKKDGLGERENIQIIAASGPPLPSNFEHVELISTTNNS